MLIRPLITCVILCASVAGHSQDAPMFRGNLQHTGARRAESDRRDERARAPYTKPDGTPNQETIYASDFYGDMVVGVERIMSMGAVISSPVIADESVYFGSADGNVYALR